MVPSFGGKAQKLRLSEQNSVGALSTTPQAALDILLSLPRLEMFIESEARKTAYRLKTTIRYNSYIINTHTEALEQLLSMDNILSAPSDRLPKLVYMFRKSFTLIYTEEMNDFCREVQWAEASYFTDGSLKSECGGYGVHCTLPEVNKSVPIGIYF